jgi:hypothetical protein
MLLNANRSVKEAGLRAIAHMPTKSLPVLMDANFVASYHRRILCISRYCLQKKRTRGWLPHRRGDYLTKKAQTVVHS